MAVYKTKPFARFPRKSLIGDLLLWEAARRADSGMVDADLGGGVIKQRIARSGEGKSGGSRAIVVFRSKRRAVFVYGFEKKDLGNIKDDELQAFRELARVILGYTNRVILGYTNEEIANRVADGALIQVEPPQEGEYA